MNYERFGLYLENGKNGVIDYKTKKIILHCNYDVESIEGDKINLRDGNVLLIENILKKLDFLTEKQKYIIVEDNISKKLGVYDTKFNILRIPCVCDKIQYLTDKKMFYVIKNGKKREITYHAIGKMKYFSIKEGVILVNNLSVYFSAPFEIDLKNGKKVELKK